MEKTIKPSEELRDILARKGIENIPDIDDIAVRLIEFYSEVVDVSDIINSGHN